jgi:aryl-alcohol dehydrogenase
VIRARAAVLRATDAPYQLETVTLEDPGPEQALVRMVGAGLCHTDQFGRSGLLGERFLPAILGHEGSGVVEAVGSAVTGVAKGDHVVLSFDSCGRCPACHQGSPAHCADFEALNLSGVGTDPEHAIAARDAAGEPLTSRWFGQSCFGEYALAGARNLVPVDREAPLELLGPLGCGVQTGAGVVLNTLRPAPGQSLVIFGAGAVGLSAVLAARLSGLRDIVAVDLLPERRELALELGATRVLDGADPDLIAQARAQAGAQAGAQGRGSGSGRADFSLDTTGLAAVMTAAVEVLGRPGKAALVGAGLEMLTVHPAQLAGRTVTYVYEGDAMPQVFIPRLVEEYRRGRFPFDRLIRQYRLDEIDVAEADMLSGRTIKPVLRITQDPP